MKSTLRSVAAVVVGFIVASILMTIVEAINGHVLHPALGKAAEGLTDREAVRALLATAPIDALLVVIFGWILGSLAGGWTAAKMAPRAPIGHGLILGGLLTLAGIANNWMIPPPVWFCFVSLMVLLPSAYLGARLLRRRPP